jgi:hypothetical protein
MGLFVATASKNSELVGGADGLFGEFSSVLRAAALATLVHAGVDVEEQLRIYAAAAPDLPPIWPGTGWNSWDVIIVDPESGGYGASKDHCDHDIEGIITVAVYLSLKRLISGVGCTLNGTKFTFTVRPVLESPLGTILEQSTRAHKCSHSRCALCASALLSRGDL